MESLRGLRCIIDLLQLKTLQPVLVKRDIEVCFPAEGAGQIAGFCRELKTTVDHLPFIADDAGRCCRTCRQGDIHQHVCGILEVVIHRQCQALIEHHRIHTDIKLIGCLPGQVRGAQIGLGNQRESILFSGFKPCLTVDMILLQIGKISYTRLVAGLSPASPDL